MTDVLEHEQYREEMHKLQAEYILSNNLDALVTLHATVKEDDRDLWQELQDELTNEQLKELELHKAL